MKLDSVVAKLWVDYRLPLATFIFFFNFYLYTLGFMNLIVQKTCFPDAPPGTNVVCRNSESFFEFNTLTTVRLTVHDVLAGIVVLIAGPWRDRTGLTLPLVVLAHVGEMIGCVMAFVSSLMWGFSSWATVIVESMSGVFGSRMLMSAATYAYVGESSTIEERPYKLVLLVVASLGGMSVASAVGGFLLRLLNYTWLMALVFGIYSLNIGLFACSIQDKRVENSSLKAVPLDIFRRVWSVFRPRKNFFVIWVLIYSNFAIFGLMNAEGAVTHAYFQKVLVLNPEQSGLLTSVRLFTSLVMALVATPILMGLFKLSAFTVSIISTIPCALSCFCMAFVSSLAQAYLFYIFDMPRVFLMSMLWTVLSTCIKSSEMGLYSSFLAFGDTIIPIFVNPLYLYIVNNTLDVFPGTFMIVSGGIITSSTVLLLIASFYYEKIEEDVTEKTPEIGMDVCEKKKADIC